METMKAVIYARVSTIEQEKEGYSIPAQLKAIRKYAFDRGITIEKEFIESESAYKSGRPEFARVISYAKSKKIDCIIAHKVDRITRNLSDLAILEQSGLKLLFVEQQFDDSPVGKFSFGIMALNARFYSDNLSQEVKKGMYEKLLQGGFPGIAPLGYLNDRNTRSIVIDKEKAALIKYAFECYGTGAWSLKTLAKELYIRGLRSRRNKRVHPSILNNTLRNPFYYGYMKMKNEIYKGSHEPLISKALFDRVQLALDGPNKAKKASHFYPLRGLLVCGECGCKITAERQRGHVYYRCTKSKGTCSQSYIREEKLIKQIERILAKIEIEKDLMELILEGCKVLEKSGKEHTDRIKNDLDKEHKRLTQRLDKLVDSYLDGKIPEDIYSNKRKSLEADRHDIEIKLSQLEDNPKNDIEHIEEILLTAHSAKTVFIKGDDRQKRDVLNMVASNMVLLNQRIASYQLKQPYKFFEIKPSEDKTKIAWAI